MERYTLVITGTSSAQMQESRQGIWIKFSDGCEGEEKAWDQGYKRGVASSIANLDNQTSPMHATGIKKQNIIDTINRLDEDQILRLSFSDGNVDAGLLPDGFDAAGLSLTQMITIEFKRKPLPPSDPPPLEDTNFDEPIDSGMKIPEGQNYVGIIKEPRPYHSDENSAYKMKTDDNLPGDCYIKFPNPPPYPGPRKINESPQHPIESSTLPKRVLIVSCSNPGSWYMDHVGRVFDVKYWSNNKLGYHIDFNGGVFLVESKDCVEWHI